MPTISVTSADRPMEPTPTRAAGPSASLPRANARITKPRIGNTNTSGSRSRALMSAVHRVEHVGVEALVAVVHLQHQRQPHADLGRGERQDQDEHDLRIGLLPAAAGGEE